MVKPLFRDWTQQEVQRDFNYLDGVMYWATGPRKSKVHLLLAEVIKKALEGYTNETTS